MRGKNIGYLVWLGCLLALLGCSGAGSLDERDERDPRLTKARSLKSAQDYDGAIAWYNKALERRPNLARAHLELGLIYDQQLNDDIRAIYHYERYLELRPEAEKKQIVEELIGHAKISFAASLPDKPSEAIREIDILKKEIATLRSLLAEAQAGSGGAASEKARSKSKSASKSAEKQVAAETEPAAKASESYVVQAGDTLSRIATRVYNDPAKWNEIFEANRATLPSPQSIKVGQTLVIPR
jgi:nucleoid-associated protein YgaU